MKLPRIYTVEADVWDAWGVGAIGSFGGLFVPLFFAMLGDIILGEWAMKPGLAVGFGLWLVAYVVGFAAASGVRVGWSK